MILQQARAHANPAEAGAPPLERLYLDAFYEEADAYLPGRLHLARLRQPDPGPVQLGAAIRALVPARP